MAKKLVVDSSVVIKWFVTEPYSAEAHLILQDYQSAAIDLVAPDLINAEVGNIIWKKQIFHGLDPVDAQQILVAFRKLTILQTPTAVLLEDAYKIAVTHQRTVYDMLYLALSLREQIPLVTADERLANAVHKNFSNVYWLGNWPPRIT